MTGTSKRSATQTSSPKKFTPNGFFFQLNPLSTLKNALKPLVDEEFNQNCMGMLEVGPQGLVISAQNKRTKVIALVRFNANELVDFRCKKRIEEKMLDLKNLHDRLDAVNDTTINIFHIDGSNELSFNYNLGINLSEVDLLDLILEPEKVGELAYDCEVVLDSEDVRTLLSLIEEHANSSKLVTCNIKATRVTFAVLWETFEPVHPTMIRGIEGGRTLTSCFQCHHSKSLKEATLGAERVSLCFTKTLKQIVWGFHLIEVGTLLYVMDVWSVLNDAPSDPPRYERRPREKLDRSNSGAARASDLESSSTFLPSNLL